MITQLRHFVAIVDHSGLTNAAKALHISQPALTRSLQSLEFKLDTVLLERSKGRIALTDSGRFLLSRARSILAEQSAMIDDLNSLKNKVGSVAYVNSSPAVAVSLLGRTIAILNTENPEYRISMRGDNGTNYPWKMEALRTGELDLVISIPSTHDSEEGFAFETILEPELKVIAPKGDVDAMAGNLADLKNRRWILPTKATSGRMIIDNEFRLNNLGLPVNTIEISDWRIALDLVASGVGITVIPYHPACFGRLEDFSVLPISYRIRPLPIVAIYRLMAMERPVVRSAITTMKQIVSETTWPAEITKSYRN